MTATQLETPPPAPPRPLSAAAQAVWDRLARRIFTEGRWEAIDAELLAVFAETMELYERFKADVDIHGTLMRGRTDAEVVRNPSLMGLASCRGDLIRLARQVPLVAPSAAGDVDGAAIDALLAEVDR